MSVRKSHPVSLKRHKLISLYGEYRTVLITPSPSGPSYGGPNGDRPSQGSGDVKAKCRDRGLHIGTPTLCSHRFYEAFIAVVGHRLFVMVNVGWTKHCR